MTRTIIVRYIENVEAGKRQDLQKNGNERKTAFKKPCGHAAPVDSSPQYVRGDLPTSAWSRQYVWRHHMPTGPATTFASLKNWKKTARLLNEKEDFE